MIISIHIYIYIYICIYKGLEGGKGDAIYHGAKVVAATPQEAEEKQTNTLPETNMETQKRPHKDYCPSKRGLYGFPC